MALTDPLSYTLNTIVNNYDRVEEGKYLKQGTTLDQPVYLSIDRTIQPDGSSSFVVKFTQAKNVVVNGIKTDDDVLQCHVVFRVPHRSFTDAEAIGLFEHLNAVLTTNSRAIGLKILTGQR